MTLAITTWYLVSRLIGTAVLFLYAQDTHNRNEAATLMCILGLPIIGEFWMLLTAWQVLKATI